MCIFSKEWKRRAVRPALILLAAAALISAYLLQIGPEMTDFGVCYQGGQRIFQGETLYRESDGHLQYKYSPASALFFIPLALLPYGTAKVIWYILEIAFLAGILFLSFQILPVAEKRATPLLAWTFLIEFKLLAREVQLGQVNLFILFLLTSTIYLLLRRKDRSAGFLWGGSLLFKPYALVFLPYFLIKRRFSSLLSGLAAALVGLTLPVAFYGIQGSITVLKEWPATLSQSTPGLLASYDNASLYGLLLKTFPSLSKQAIGAVFLMVFLGLALAVLWMIKKGQAPTAPQNPEVLESAFLLILIPFFSPLGWNYNYLYSIPAIMIVIATWKRLPPVARVVLLANFVAISASIIEIWGRALIRFYTHHALVAINFLIVLVALLYLRLKNIG